MRPPDRWAAVAAILVAGCGAATPGAGPADGASTRPAAAPTGPAAPDVTLELFDGSSTSMAALEGTPVVVNFWASWCPPCIAEMPDLERVHREVDGAVEFVGVNTSDERPSAEALAAETGVTYPLARDPDGALAQAFGVRGMPSTFFVAADGTVVGVHTGLLDDEFLRRRLDELFGVDQEGPG